MIRLKFQIFYVHLFALFIHFGQLIELPLLPIYLPTMKSRINLDNPLIILSRLDILILAIVGLSHIIIGG